MDLLDAKTRAYDWGTTDAIAELQGRPVPAPGPEAELWMGAHPTAPSGVRRLPSSAPAPSAPAASAPAASAPAASAPAASAPAASAASATPLAPPAPSVTLDTLIAADPQGEL